MNSDYYKWLDNKIMERDVVAMQAGKVTQEQRDYYNTPKMRQQFRSENTTPVDYRELEQRRKLQESREIEREQLRQMAEQRRWDSLTPDQQFEEESLLAAEQLVQLSAAKLAKARSLRQHAAAERYELELEQRQAKLLETKERLAAVNRQVEAVAELRDDVDYQYALTCAKSAVDVTDRGTEAHTRAQLHLHELETATPANFKQRMAEFHSFDAERLAARVAELRAAEHAAIVEATPKVNEALELGRQAAETALQQHNATRNVGAEQ